MSESYEIRLPIGMDNAGIDKFLRDNINLYRPAFDLAVIRYNDRAEFSDLDIDEIDIEDDLISITYTVHYYVYSGCKDINDSGWNNGLVIQGKRTGNIVTFAEAEHYIPRSTFDEL